MEKLVGGDGIEWVKTLLDGSGVDFDRGGVGVLHSASRRAAGKVVEKRVAVEGTVVHPAGRGGDDLVQRSDNFIGVVVGRIGVNDDAKVGAGLIEIFFLELADFDGRVDELVVVVGMEFEIGGRQRHRSAPLARQVAEKKCYWRASRVNRVHQDLRQVQKCVMS